MTEPAQPEPTPTPEPGDTHTAGPPVRFYRTGWFIGLTSAAAGFALATALFLPRSDTENAAADTPSTNGSGDGSGTETVERTEDPSAVLTDEGDSGGLYLKAVKVTREDSITYAGGTSSDITPDANAVTKRATGGGYFLVVSTDGRNGTKEPIDLTCGFPIDIAVFGTDDAKYTPIEGLDQIKGNPGCNDQVQPGQKFSEKFIFLMPEGADPEQMVWASVNSDLDSAASAGIDLAGK